MELSVSEVFLLSVLFAIPQILIFLVTCGVYYFRAGRTNDIYRLSKCHGIFGLNHMV